MGARLNWIVISRRQEQREFDVNLQNQRPINDSMSRIGKKRYTLSSALACRETRMMIMHESLVGAALQY
jgi:hypothetical protein